MDIALLLVGLTATVLAVTALSERASLPAPLTLIVVGVVLSFVPGVPVIELDADIVLFGLLPPLLYSAAISGSLVDFNANRRPILLLSVGLVIFTTLGVGALLHTIIPDLGWPAALAIGAVVAPPDAVAATAIGRRIGLPRRIVTILEGESLFNDATALVALRTAIAAAGTGITFAEVGLDFLLAAGGGLVVGFVFFWVIARVRRHVTDPLFDTGISFVVPFAAYVAAEEIHGSGVVAVVVAGLLLGHKAPILQTAQSRIAERMNWRSIAYLLENAVFLLIGLQAARLFDDLSMSSLGTGTIVTASLATLAAVIALRLVWVFPARYLLVRPGADPVTGGRPPGWQYTFLLGWAGMRGVVTLAAAFVIPMDTEHRQVLLIIAFTVVAGTLLIQGLSLPWLARRLDVEAPDPVDDALARATLLQQASKAGFKRLHELEYDDPHGVIASIKNRVEQRNFAAWERLGTVADEESPSDLYSRVRGEMIEAERRRVLEVRSSGQVPSEVVSDVLAMLDVEESMLDYADEERDHVRSARTRPVRDQCEDLERYPVRDPEAGTEMVCPQCVIDGTRWVALRMCLECGALGCCDSSPARHATNHFRETTHPVMRSVEPDEDWRWCFMHHVTA